MNTASQNAPYTAGSADKLRDFDMNHAAPPIAIKPLSVALIGPDEERRTVVAKALVDSRRAIVREFNSYPPEVSHLQRLLTTFDVVILDLDSDPDVALELMEGMSVSDAATIMVYSEKNDPKLAIRLMRAGAREYLLLPFERGAIAEALIRAAATREEVVPGEKSLGGLRVFAGSKGGSGVTTVACNVAIALAQNSDQKILLIDLALPIGDVALCLGISAGYSAEDALRNIDRLDASFLQNLLVRHRSGVFVLAAPTKVPEVEVSKDAIDKLIAIARRDFDHVIVDVGSRIDVAAKALFQDASTIYLVTQTGISDLRNSNRLISQFFAEGSQNLEIVINRFDSRFLEPANEDVIAKALGRPVRWKFPDDQDAARALQSGDSGFPETRISRISLEIAGSITGRPVPQEKKWDFDLSDLDTNIAAPNSGSSEPPTATFSDTSADSAESRTTPTIMWPAPEPITYGHRLTFGQLNATASADGTLVYTPGPGYVLPVGTHTLWVTFTPADSNLCAPLQTGVSIVVAKAAPAISWPTPEKIVYGTALGGAQLNASASIPGKFDYAPAPGEMLPPGMHTLSVTFTPADTANYNPSHATVSLSVAKAKSEIHWPAPAPITYGTQLSGAQLCAASSVQGSFEYNPGLGAVLAAGEHKVSVVFTPADPLGYSTSRAAVSVTVAKATPAVKWGAPDPISHGVALSAIQLNAVAPVPGSFAFTPAAGAKLAPGVHELSATFTPTDTLNYSTVRAVVSLTVTEKSPTIVTWPVPSAISYGTALSDIQLNATASVPGTFVYTPSAGHVLAQGKYTLSASFTPADPGKHATAQATVELEVKGSAFAAPLPAAADESPSEWTSTATGSAPADPVPDAETAARAAAEMKPRETRSYKGAVYEKGEDGQWHLQKK
jgi:MinD-like ATPase involved in chromosome partitioning or flagellar assembly/CheY-like chemotaxis protein